MKNEFNGIERRLDELNDRLARLQPFQQKTLDDLLTDPYLMDIIERNLEIVIQCCIDIYKSNNINLSSTPASPITNN